MKFLKNKYFKNFLTIATITIVGYFFTKSLLDNWQAVQAVSFKFNLLSVVSILLFAFAVVVSGFLWGVIINNLTKSQDKKVSLTLSAFVHIESWLLKYVPGHIGSLMNKVVWAKKNGYGKKQVLVTVVYENIFLLSASLIPTIPIILLTVGGNVFLQNAVYLIAPIFIIIPIYIVTNKKTMHAIMDWLFTKMLKQPVGNDLFLNTYDAVRIQVLFIIPRLINGLGFVLVVASFLDVSATAYLPLAAAYVIAGAVGIMAFVVPSGLGVREAVIVIIGANFMPIEQAIIAAVVARLYSSVADGLLAVVYGYMKLSKKGINI